MSSDAPGAFVSAHGILNAAKQFTQRKRLSRRRNLHLRILHTTQQDRMKQPVEHLSLQRQHGRMNRHILPRRREVTEINKALVLQLVEKPRREFERRRREQIVTQ